MTKIGLLEGYGPSGSVETYGAHEEFPITPQTETFATDPIEVGFNLPEIMENARIHKGVAVGQEVYLAVFRSEIKPGIAEPMHATLLELDDKAHQEAAGSDGYIRYFKGIMDEKGNCLSFCLWASREDAVSATRKTAHAAAVGIASQVYAWFRLDRAFLTLNSDGHVSLRPFTPAGVLPK
ncbi:MAG: hypothetical protein WD887_00700 [Candidatus Saccharimonadales bacterium]